MPEATAVDRGLQERRERRRNRDDVRMAALGRLALVGAPDRDQASIDVDIALAQPTQLSLA